MRTRIRNLRKPIEASGINYDQIFRSIQNLSSSRDTLDLYFGKVYKDIVNIKKNKISIKYNDFQSLNNEMKMKIFEQSIKKLSNMYYSPRSKKIFNLIEQIKKKNSFKQTLGGCLILKEKNQIILIKEKKNQ